MSNDILSALEYQAAQLEMLTETFHMQTKQQGIYTLRDLALLKVLILELEETLPGIAGRLQKRLDKLILHVGDDPQLCESIRMANQFLAASIKA